MERPGDQLLARPRLTHNQHRRICGGHRLDRLEHPCDHRALPDDLLEIVLGLDLLLEIAVLLFQSGAQPPDLLVRQHVLDRQRDLVTDLLQEPDILG